MSNQISYAFPSENDQKKQYHYVNKGMTLRDYFAAKAMHALISRGDTSPNANAVLAHDAYRIAQAMLDQATCYEYK